MAGRIVERKAAEHARHDSLDLSQQRAEQLRQVERRADDARHVCHHQRAVGMGAHLVLEVGVLQGHARQRRQRCEQLELVRCECVIAALERHDCAGGLSPGGERHGHRGEMHGLDELPT